MQKKLKNRIDSKNLNLISIVLPIYNGSNYMKEAIESALNQTYKNIEVIVVNDGSTDNTEEIALSYGNKIRYFKKENGGVATALNLAIREAKGEYISWLSHDDVYYPNKIQAQINVLNELEDKNTIIYSGFNKFFVEKNKTRTVKISDIIDINDDKLFNSLKILMKSCLHGCTLLIPKKCFDEVGYFNETLKTTQDYDLWYKFIKNGYFFYLIDKPLILQRIHKNQDSNSKLDLVKKEVIILNKTAIGLFQNEIKKFNLNQNKFFVENLREKGYFDLIKQIKPLSNLQIGDIDLFGNKFNGHDLHLYLRENEIEANHYVKNKFSQDKNTYLYQYAENSKEFIKNLIRHSLFIDADILHLHLIHNTNFDINYLPVITKLKPTVITLHDPFFLGGHCIHHFDCEKWKTHCHDCEYLDKPFIISEDTSALNFEIKKQAIQNSNIVAIVASKWMEDKVKQSPIWKGKKVYRVPFGINQDLFKPADKNQIRKELGIDQNSFVLMLRSDTSPYKGLDTIKKTLRDIKSEKKITIITTAQKGNIKEFNKKFKIKEYGWINNDKLMAKLYQASDLFLMPSTQEAFGMMAIEAMSCGVPVLSVLGTSLSDVINSPECGIAVEKEAFTKTLQRLIDDKQEIQKRSSKSLEFAQKNYNKDEYVQKIINIYKETINDFHLEESSKLILEQLQKIPIKTYKKNILVKIFYRIFLRPLLKMILGKSFIKKNKLDEKLG